MNLMTLIPAFKPQYLPELIVSLERQTVRPDAVLLSDDNPNAEFTRLLQGPDYAARCAALNLSVMRGPCRGAFANVRALVEAWGGRSRHVHLLLDDDVCYPEFYERHLALHAAGDFMATVSLRWTADERGQPLERARLPAALVAHGAKRVSVDAALAFATTVGESLNWFGEFSNIVLRAEHVPFIVAPQIAGVPLIGLEDLACVLAASLHGPVGLLNEHLGFFRSSAQQNTSQIQGPIMRMSTCAWVPLALAARRAGRLDDAQAERCIQRMGMVALHRYAGVPELAPLLAPLAALVQGDRRAEAPLLDAWQAYAASQAPQAVADALAPRLAA